MQYPWDLDLSASYENYEKLIYRYPNYSAVRTFDKLLGDRPKLYSHLPSLPILMH